MQMQLFYDANFPCRDVNAKFIYDDANAPCKDADVDANLYFSI